MPNRVPQESPEMESTDPFIFKAWQWWKIVWAVLKNIFYILLILFAFDKASSIFENVVICFLVLIFQSVTWASTVQLRLTIEETFSNKRLLLSILKKSGEETEDAEEIIAESEKEYLKQNKLYYINLGGALVVYFIILWKLVVTLLA
jgi:hypothetical protein